MNSYNLNNMLQLSRMTRQELLELIKDKEIYNKLLEISSRIYEEDSNYYLSEYISGESTGAQDLFKCFDIKDDYYGYNSVSVSLKYKMKDDVLEFYEQHKDIFENCFSQDRMDILIDTYNKDKKNFVYKVRDLLQEEINLIIDTPSDEYMVNFLFDEIHLFDNLIYDKDNNKILKIVEV